MTHHDLHDLLDVASTGDHPERDRHQHYLSHGRASLRRRRMAGVGAGAVGALAIGGLSAVALTRDDTPAREGRVAAEPSASVSTSPAHSSSPTPSESASTAPLEGQRLEPAPLPPATHYPTSDLDVAVPEGFTLWRDEQGAAVFLLPGRVDATQSWQGKLAVMVGRIQDPRNLDGEAFVLDGRQVHILRQTDDQDPHSRAAIVTEQAGHEVVAMIQYPQGSLTDAQAASVVASVIVGPGGVVGVG